MNTLNKLSNWHMLAGGALLLLANAAQAQYIWIDEKGLKQVSDRAPPASTPVKNILKSPTPIKDPVDSGNLLAQKAAPAAPTIAEREAEHRKNMAEKAQKDKEAADKGAVQAQRSAACNAARVARSQLDSGVRLKTADGFMDDAQRAQQSARANAALRDCAAQ